MVSSIFPWEERVLTFGTAPWNRLNEDDGGGGGDSGGGGSDSSGSSTSSSGWSDPVWTYTPPGDQAPVDQTNFTPVDDSGNPTDSFDFSGSSTSAAGNQDPAATFSDQSGTDQAATAPLGTAGLPNSGDTFNSLVNPGGGAPADPGAQAAFLASIGQDTTGMTADEINWVTQQIVQNNPTILAEMNAGSVPNADQTGQWGANIIQSPIGSLQTTPIGLPAPSAFPQLSHPNPGGPPTAADASGAIVRRQAQDYVRAAAAVADALTGYAGLKDSDFAAVSHALQASTGATLSDGKTYTYEQLQQMQQGMLTQPDVLGKYNALLTPPNTKGPAAGASTKATALPMDSPLRLKLQQAGYGNPYDPNLTQADYDRISQQAQQAGRQQQEAALNRFGRAQVQSNQQAQRTSTADRLVQTRGAIAPQVLSSVNASLSEQGLPTIDPTANNAQQQMDFAQTLLPHLLAQLTGPNGALLRPAISQMLVGMGFQALPTAAQQGAQGVMPNGIDPATWDRLPNAAKTIILQAWQSQGGNSKDFEAGVNAQRPAGSTFSGVSTRYAGLRV